ncbi:hypothetical protein Tco_0175461 [Tanacetum coccineum]
MTVRLEPPMSASMEARIAEHAATPIPPTRPAYDQAPLGHRAAIIRIRDDILEDDMPPWRIFVFTAPPTWGVDVAESSASEHRMMTSIEEVHCRSLPGHKVRKKERPKDPLYRQSWHEVRRGFLSSELRNRALLCELEDTRDSLIRIGRAVLRAVGTEGIVGLSQWLEKMESVFHISGCTVDNQVKFATCTLLGAALTWWNGHVRTLGHDVAYAITLGTLKKKFTDKYCPKGEIKKIEIEL